MAKKSIQTHETTPAIAPALASASGLDVDLLSDEYDEAFLEEDARDALTRAPVHEDDADPIVLPKLVSTRPGPVRTQGQIVLHTRAAHRLFYGRRKDEKRDIKPVIGLVRFSTNVNNIFKLAEHNDPYADAVLMKIEDKMTAATTLIDDCIKSVDELLGSMGELTITSIDSVEPVVLPLEFKTAYGFMGARLLGQYDRLVRLCLSARHVGLLFADDWGRMVGNTGSKIREVFWLSTSYRYTGVSRDDIAANNAAARRAIDKYGALPQSVLEGTHRARFAPVVGTS